MKKMSRHSPTKNLKYHKYLWIISNYILQCERMKCCVQCILRVLSSAIHGVYWIIFSLSTLHPKPKMALNR